ncbi:FtsX-like permease family protein [Frankia sp. AiPs1]|uniref:FtsX-like permease family protein n=1 Tax=Frankia sp. AiPa1 TaxID=573492 RepID=UPI00202B08FA|nr:FtsX-like permease family protein [Frankia sp. AiPa1]MCL9759845.1 ABC transporter permease [Frankia sp. AiPa1]
MIRLGLRLAVAGGREAVSRLALIAVGVAVGAALLLTTMASLNAVDTQNSRYAWLETAFSGSNAPTAFMASGRSAPSFPSSSPPSASSAASLAGTSDPLWWRLRADYFQGREIGRVDVAATGPRSPAPPGIARLPGPGQFYASPALATLLRGTPAAQLGDRFPGSLVGLIGSAALPAPNSLIVIVGHSAADLSQQDDVGQVTAISTTTPADCTGTCALGIGINSNGMTLILSVVIAALLFPILIFIAGATRLSAARREQRFAAMRLIGATPRQISVISAVESSMAAFAGVAGGFGLFYAARPPLARIPLTGQLFFTEDLALSIPDVLLVAVGIPAAAAVAARVALRRVSISPLGVARRVTPRPPRAWRVIPLAAGLGELGYCGYVADIGANSDTSTNLQAAAFLTGILLTMVGLVAAGPWLTMLCARLMAGRARRPATLIAARRLADNPHAGFRAISGLVLALFVSTCAIGVVTTIAAYNGGRAGAVAARRSTIVREFDNGPSGPTSSATSVPTATWRALTSIPGVAGVTLIRRAPVFDPSLYPPPGIVSCAELARVPVLGRCSAGAGFAMINTVFGGGLVHGASPMSDTRWPTVAVSGAELGRLPLDSIVVATDGSSAAVERVRTVLDLAYPRPFAPQTLTEFDARNAQQLDSYRRLANVVIFAGLPVAGCGLAVSIVGGLADRRRPFSLLRLTGVPLAVLRRVIALEAAVPLVVAAAVAAGIGLLAAQLFLRGQLSETLHLPGVGYYLLVLAGLVASLAVVASTMPLLARSTGPETARNE